ncbi:hypothetical protein FRAAL6279 [Frankia alni ACN14a]|uniref:Uncharacterized protein n=1 Tax=Frankia alni (strain DSM 45986 / CECT 9034 / ACN14a) TaxID=326424 RepID=Q0RCC4_FRAAA|nr:hypothetical protein FRAAL6279 [Frankia alni ACN14a]
MPTGRHPPEWSTSRGGTRPTEVTTRATPTGIPQNVLGPRPATTTAPDTAHLGRHAP